MVRKISFVIVCGACLLGVLPFVYATSQFDAMKNLESVEKGPAGLDNSFHRPTLEYKGDTLRDPFKSPIVKSRIKNEEIRDQSGQVAAPPPLTIQALLWGSALPQAIVNNKIVKENDTIEGVKILIIDKEGLTVLYKNRQFIIPAPAKQYLELIKRTPEGGMKDGK
jgi:hypothetical protein